MTKEELRQELLKAGIDAPKWNITKDELQEMYDGLHIHRRTVMPTEPTEPGEPGEPIDPNAPVEPVDPNAPPTEPTEQPTGDEDFDKLLGNIKGADIPHPKTPIEKPIFEKTKRKSKKGDSSSDSFRIEGYILLLMVDVLFPFAFAFANNMLDKKHKIEAPELQLAEKDFNKLEPLANQAADYMAVNLNPIAGFFIVAAFMYGNNLISIRMQIDMKNGSSKVL